MLLYAPTYCRWPWYNRTSFIFQLLPLSLEDIYEGFASYTTIFNAAVLRALDKDAVPFKYIKIESWIILIIECKVVVIGVIRIAVIRVITSSNLTSTKNILLCNTHAQIILQSNQQDLIYIRKNICLCPLCYLLTWY